jgi:Ca2+-binding EF-hand superfamily protein
MMYDDDDFIDQMGTAMYIDFAEFAKILSLFNPRTGIDEKIQFYFRLFDVNEDKKIDR